MAKWTLSDDTPANFNVSGFLSGYLSSDIDESASGTDVFSYEGDGLLYAIKENGKYIRLEFRQDEFMTNPLMATLVLDKPAKLKALLEGDSNVAATLFKGSDKLAGSDHDDLLQGFRGNDKLTGGDGSDTFVFATKSGRDTIADFDSGVDAISLEGWKAIDNFADVKSHAKNHGDDVWITAGKDVLIIDGVHKAQLHGSDFDF